MVTKRSLRMIGIAILAAAALLCSAGCSAHEAAQPEGALESEWVKGTVTDIAPSEILIDVTSDSTGSLTGDMRVSIGEIDDATVKSIEEGSTAKIVYSGVVGMSNPPFISATELTVTD